MMDKIKTIRYMGTKAPLLEYIIPCIESVTPENGIVFDIMAGSNAVSYALKKHFTVYTNDVQEYSFIISNALITNQTETISKDSAIELQCDYKENLLNKYYCFFEQTYSETYFSQKQCCDIDSLRYAIEKIDSPERKSLYLLALMSAMCKVQSTPGHFAQFMPSTHYRIIPLQKMDLYQEFLTKCDNYSHLVFSDKNNKSFCNDYKVLLKECDDIKQVDTIYLDSPYSQEQYSRFYHVLETVVKYDLPKVDFKAKYRNDRFRSSFCYKNKVKEAFEEIITFCKENDINLVISYSNKALLSVDDLLNLCKNYFHSVSIQYIDYKHSTQGKGSNTLKEILITCSNNIQV